MRSAVHYLPILTSALAFWFAPQLFRRWRGRRPAPHLFWWGLGVVLYGVGTVTESLTTLIGWREPVFRAWYISGALLGGAPLVQGTAYLLLRRRTANFLTIIMLVVVGIAAACVLLSPIALDRVEPYRLSGQVLEWTWVRRFSPFINSYAFLMLVGGALLSAWRFRAVPGSRGKVLGNACVALGGLLPGIGGTFTRFGHVEVLYATELAGLLLIYAGYRLNIAVAPVVTGPVPSGAEPQPGS